MQKFNFLQATTTLKNMYQELIDTLESLLSNNSGTARPTSNLRIGMKFFNETTQVTETLVSLAPAAWVSDDSTLAGKSSDYYANLCQGGSTQDPNVAVTPTLLTNHANGPGQGLYWHITTTFYSTVTSTGNRAQTAVSYHGTTAKTAVRHCYNTVWTPWVPLASNELVESTQSQLDALVNLLYPVSTVVFRMDAINPGTIYGGVWTLMSGDATITFGDGSAQSGAASGDNTPIVPVPQHRHSTPNHDHGASFSGNTLPDHYHSIPTFNGPYTGGTGTLEYGNESSIVGYYSSAGASAGRPSGTVSVASGGASNTGYTGGSGADIDVRGSRVAINVWKRTS